MDIGGENKKNVNSGNKSEKTSSKFGRVIKALHNKAKLPSLRTYQGDMAKFIKEKNESVISIAVKEKEKKEKILTKEKKEKLIHQPTDSPKKKTKNLQINFTMVILSLLLILGGVVASFYVFKALKTKPLAKVVLKQKIIPYNNSITLANVTKINFGSELARLHPKNGITILKISGTDGLLFQKSGNFFNFLGISLPSDLERTLKDKYMVGIISQDKKATPFIILTVDDFGRAFSAMLNWEGKIKEDLSFLNQRTSIYGTGNITVNNATTTVSATTTNIATLNKPDIFYWKDIIVKNKDTRALINSKNQAQIAYTFLDKNTILIIGDLSSIGEISSIYASRSIVR